MQHLDRLYGTTERAPALQTVQIGPLSFLYSHDGLRRITWHGTELVRAIAWPIRDENWGTYALEDVEENVDVAKDSFSSRVNFTVGKGRLACELHLAATIHGDLRADLTMTPVEGPFATNRAGFTVLHPIRGVAGEPLSVRHSDGTTEDTVFPRLISPDQPAMDISGMQYGVGSASVDIAFEGEIFEMEDQRNWSDASYKTYCVPLVHPFTYSLGSPITQTIQVRCSGIAKSGGRVDREALAISVADGVAPRIGLALEEDWIGSPASCDLIAETAVSHLLIRGKQETAPEFWAASGDLSRRLDAEIDLEIVLQDGQDVEPGLRTAADAMTEAGLMARRVLALPESYLASYQPSGPWPSGPTPSDLYNPARRAFPGATIGGGMMTNFTEFNRCKPDPSSCDFITHGSTAIVHAGDDLSVLETLEALPQIFASARAIGAGLPYRLGLVSIGMRSNPYGSDVAANPNQVRQTMAREDPRQRGLFAAAWAVGVLAATGASSVEALCLAAPVGPFGMVYEKQTYPQIGYDGGQGVVYPLFHVVREACRMAGADRLAIAGLPEGLAAYGVRQAGRRRLMIANTSSAPQTVILEKAAPVVVLDASSFVDAVTQVDWLETTDRPSQSEFELGPFGVSFVTLID